MRPRNRAAAVATTSPGNKLVLGFGFSVMAVIVYRLMLISAGAGMGTWGPHTPPGGMGTGAAVATAGEEEELDYRALLEGQGAGPGADPAGSPPLVDTPPPAPDSHGHGDGSGTSLHTSPLVRAGAGGEHPSAAPTTTPAPPSALLTTLDHAAPAGTGWLPGGVVGEPLAPAGTPATPATPAATAFLTSTVR
jgi:hypothetical protein